jgi:transcriptional regulator with XRE-family HTH domain
MSNRLPVSLDDRETSTAVRMSNEAKVADMILKGYSQKDIAATLEINPNTLRWYVHKLTEEWRERGQAAIDVVKARELAKIDLIEKEAWAAWERSQEDTEEETVEHTFTRSENVKTKRKGQVGDGKFLDVVFKCIEKRLRLFGITEIGPVNPFGGSDDDRTDLAKRLQRYDAVLLNRPAILLAAGNPHLDHSGEPVDSERPASETGVILDAHGSVR